MSYSADIFNLCRGGSYFDRLICPLSKRPSTPSRSTSRPQKYRSPMLPPPSNRVRRVQSLSFPKSAFGGGAEHFRSARVFQTSRYRERVVHLDVSPAAPGSAQCEQHFAAHNPRAESLRQKSICDNQSHHAPENQQCGEGFSDHWPRRMARSR